MNPSVKQLEEEIKLIENAINNLNGLEIPEISVGDKVHVGLVTPSGSGMSGIATKIEGDNIYIKNSEGRTFRGLLKNARLIEHLSESKTQTARVEFFKNQIFVEGKLSGTFATVVENGHPVVCLTLGETSKSFGLQLPNLKKVLENYVTSMTHVLDESEYSTTRRKMQKAVGKINKGLGKMAKERGETGFKHDTVKDKSTVAKAVGKMNKDQQLNELDKSTLLSYIDKATKDSVTHARRAGQHGEKSLRYYDRNINDISNVERKKAIDSADKAHKRSRGIVNAAIKLAK